MIKYLYVKHSHLNYFPPPPAKEVFLISNFIVTFISNYVSSSLISNFSNDFTRMIHTRTQDRVSNFITACFIGPPCTPDIYCRLLNLVANPLWGVVQPECYHRATKMREKTAQGLGRIRGPTLNVPVVYAGEEVRFFQRFLCSLNIFEFAIKISSTIVC